MARTELARKVYLEDGSTLTVRVVDGLLIDDIIVLAMKAEGHRVITKRDVFPAVGRKLKDFLIRTGVLLE